MKLTLRPIPALKLGLECPVCLRLRDEPQAADDSTEAAIFGVKAYVHCPGCQQFVTGELLRDPDYRRRARVKHFQATGQVWR